MKESFNKKKTEIILISLLILLVISMWIISFAYLKIETENLDKQCSDLNMVFFPGGSKDSVFSSRVYNGAIAAQNDLGIDVEYMWSDWDEETMLLQFKEAIMKKPDGIAIMGHPGEADLGPLIDEAEREGIIVTSQNVELSLSQEKYSGSGFGYVGAENLEAGRSLAKVSIQKFAIKEGDKVLVWGLLGSEGERSERTKGIIEAFEGDGIFVDYLEISSDIDSGYDSGQEALRSFLNKNPSSKFIIVDHGGLTSRSSSLLKELGKKPGEIVVIGFDLSLDVLLGIKEGYIGIILDQQPYLQGYLPVLQVCLTKKYGFGGLDIDTGSGFVDSSNIDFISDLVEEKIR